MRRWSSDTACDAAACCAQCRHLTHRRDPWFRLGLVAGSSVLRGRGRGLRQCSARRCQLGLEATDARRYPGLQRSSSGSQVGYVRCLGADRQPFRQAGRQVTKASGDPPSHGTRAAVGRRVRGLISSSMPVVSSSAFLRLCSVLRPEGRRPAWAGAAAGTDGYIARLGGGFRRRCLVSFAATRSGAQGQHFTASRPHRRLRTGFRPSSSEMCRHGDGRRVGADVEFEGRRDGVGGCVGFLFGCEQGHGRGGVDRAAEASSQRGQRRSHAMSSDRYSSVRMASRS